MRASGWILPLTTLVFWGACIGWPFIASLAALGESSHREVEVRPLAALLMTSVVWAALVAIGAIILGWIPGRVLGSALGRGGFVPIAVLLLVPICLPSYVVYYAWWQSWPADSALFRWLTTHGHMQSARYLTLYLGLVCWSWPLVTWAVAWAKSNRQAQRDELLLLDGASAMVRFVDRFRTDAPGLGLGGLLVFLATLNNTTSFDLAEVFTFANELRAIEALDAAPRDVLSTALPMLIICAAGAWLAWRLITGPRAELATHTAPVSAAGKFITALVWIATVVLPLILFSRHIFLLYGSKSLMQEFLALYPRSVPNTVARGLLSGFCGALLGIGLFQMWVDHRAIIRRAAAIISITFIIAAVLPGTIIGVALRTAYPSADFGRALDRTGIILNIGHIACFGFVAALMARWCAARQPEAIRMLQRLDDVAALSSLVRAAAPQIAAIAVASFAVIAVFALGEIPVTAVVSPPARPGYGPLALTLLNDMHYQRPQTIMVAAIGMTIAALISATLVALAWRVLRSISGMGQVA